jgi:L-aspartate oxidase
VELHSQEVGLAGRTSDFLVVGSGVAGLLYALRVAEVGTVTVITKKRYGESNTNYAQGGVASVIGDDDSFDLHVKDTLRAGAGLCHEDAVRIMVQEGPGEVSRLIELGASFSLSPEGGRLALGREGGHSRRRIVHAVDRTGREIERVLMEKVAAHPRVKVFENHIMVDLIMESRMGGRKASSSRDRCWGAFVMNAATGRIASFGAKTVLLATGGCGKVYLYTSNPDIATGDGVAAAYRAGARIANLEFMQFHPTCLYHPEAKTFLISEAVRGEGAILTRCDGSEFMSRYHKMGCLAPRDVVARAIDREMKRSGDKHVLLDMTLLGKAKIASRFPNIYERCLGLGLDPVSGPLPVVPAAHYMCGGVPTDLEGRTDIEGLLACGEVACTGVHGANRLASNSLLEALVYSRRASDLAIKSYRTLPAVPSLPEWETRGARKPRETVAIDHTWDTVRRVMWDYVGIVRTGERLEAAERRLDVLRKEIEGYYVAFLLDPDLVELRNIALLGDLIVECARSRKESRGLHYLLEHPRRDDANWRRDTYVRKGRSKAYRGPALD